MATLILVIFCIANFIWYKVISKKHPPLPPGPPGEPIIGHLRTIPPDSQDTFFYDLGKVYGDVIHFNILGRHIIVLNSVQAAVDLLDNRSANYSDRPYFPVYNLIGMGKSLIFARYGKYFQMHRRMYQRYLNKDSSMAYHPIQSREARNLVQHLLDEPELREEHLIRYSTAIAIRIAYGHQITSDSDLHFKLMKDLSIVSANCGPPGGTPIDLFPFLQYFPSWFPGAYYANYARAKQPSFAIAYEYPFTEVEKQMASGTAEPSFLMSQIEALKEKGTETPEMIQHLQAAAGTIFLAGGETTATTLSHFFLAMVHHPECQAIVQEEIDTITGSGRLPELSDRVSLPYLECVLQETLRWNLTVPLGIPHRSLADDIYNGMFIPKGSIIIANARAMTWDENIYTDPFRFNPARYLPKPEGLGEPHPIGPFGFGRRICPGRYLADDSLWIAMATILATLAISKATDKDDKEITPELSFDSGLTSHPRPFPCRLEPRTDLAKSLITHVDMLDSY